MSDVSADTGLRQRLKAEAGLLELVRDNSTDVVMHAQCVRGRWTLELLTWTGKRRQRVGRGGSFVEAWRAAFPANDGSVS